MSSAPKVLLVDDEPNVLDGYRRQLRKQFDIVTALGGASALQVLRDVTPAVIVSDMRMPEMDGVELLKRVQEASPNTVRMMLTGNADQETAIRAVNEGSIFRFMSKPCPPEALAGALSAGIEQHRLITAEKTLLQRTLRGSILMLTEVLELSAPASFGRGKRIQRLAQQVAEQVGVPNRWKIDLAALFAQTGHITLPPDVLARVNKGADLTAQEREMLARSLQVAGQLVGHIPRLEGVARMLDALDDAGKDSQLPPDERASTQILRAVHDFDSAQLRGAAPVAALAALRTAENHPVQILDALATILDIEVRMENARVAVRALSTGMILDEDLKTENGQLLVTKGQEVTLALRERLRNFIVTGKIDGDVAVLIPVESAGPGAADS